MQVRRLDRLEPIPADHKQQRLDIRYIQGDGFEHRQLTRRIRLESIHKDCQSARRTTHELQLDDEAL